MKVISLIISIILFSLTTSSASAQQNKMVFAHYMVCCPQAGLDATVADYKWEITQAQKFGIDGFSLNNGDWVEKDPSYKKRTLRIYQAAKELGTNFKLFISVDGNARKELVDVVATIRQLPNQLVIDGKPVLSAFDAGGKNNAGAVSIIQQAKKLGTYFVPHFFPASGERPIDQSIARSTVASFGAADGFFFFGGAGNGVELAQSNKFLAREWVAAGKTFMASVTPYYRGHGVNARVYETNGFESMASEWESAIANKAQWVQIVTWNDWSESTYVTPLLNENIQDVWGGHFGKVMPSHRAYLAASQHYINWFRSGKQPAVQEDQLFYFYKLHLKSRSAEHRDEKVTLKNQGTLSDSIYFTAMLKKPARITVKVGDGAERSFDVPAGINHISTPSDVGVPVFTIFRNGTLVKQKIAEQPIGTNSDSYFNYFSGILN